MKPKKHIFVCVHERPAGDPRGSCRERGSRRVLDALKGGLFQHDLLGEIKATGTTCLGHCEHGVTAVVYPEGTWYRKLQVEDVDDIIEEHMLDGEPVARLLLDEADI